MRAQNIASVKTLPNLHDDALQRIHLFVALCIATIMLLMLTQSASATTSAMGTALCNVAQIVYGNLGKGLATLAVIVLGVGALLGKTSWGLALTVATGIAVIFNAGNIVMAILPTVSVPAACLNP